MTPSGQVSRAACASTTSSTGRAAWRSAPPTTGTHTPLRSRQATSDFVMPAAIAWSLYEGSCSTLVPDPEELKSFAGDVLALGLARMETHYFRNNIFLPENFLLENVDRIRKIPTFIVQGRYDLVCPIRTADDLTRRWPEARYEIIADAGHAKAEPGIRKALMDGMDRFRNLG